jgi:flagellar motor switch protein FliN
MSSNKPAELSAVIACAAQARAASAFSPLAPYLPPPGAELHPTQAAQLEAAHAEARRWHDELLRHARGVQRYLHWSYADLCDEALRIPDRLKALATVDGRSNFDPVRLVDVAERVFGIKVRGKGETAEARLHARVARVLDAAYWRRTLRRRVAQEVELLELKLKRVGRNGSAYCSAQAQHLRETQRRAQAQWLEETTLQAVIDGEQVELPMAAVAKTARQKMSRLGESTITVGELLRAKEHQVIRLDRTLSEPVDVMLEGKVVARGELVAIDDQFAVRITELPVPLKP